jgi:hypothetical protein
VRHTRSQPSGARATMEKFALLAVLLLLIWAALKIARFFVRLVLFLVIIAIVVIGYFVYLR